MREITLRWRGKFALMEPVGRAWNVDGADDSVLELTALPVGVLEKGSLLPKVKLDVDTVFHFARLDVGKSAFRDTEPDVLVQ